MKTKIYKVVSVILALVMVLSCSMYAMGTTISNSQGNLSLAWIPSNETQGSAGGTYTLSANDSSAYGKYELYYADDEGVLTEYAPITECELNLDATQVQYNGMIDQNVLPVGATKVVATLDGQIKAYIDIPTEKQFQAGELLYSHAVFSDVHVFGDKTQDYNGYDDLPIALDTVMNMGAQFLSVSGDLTYDDGLATLKEVLSGYEDYDINVCTGNHDVGISKTEWTSYWGHDMDYSFTYRGETFIYLSLQTANGYGDEKIEWLAEEMKKAAGKRIYLFMHFPIPEHAGLKPDYYYGFSETSTEDDRIMSLIRQYGNTYVFSGHTHFNFQCQNDCQNITVTPIEGTNSYTIHVPSIAYPRLINTWNMYNQSQGYFVEVYEDGIVLKGIDFKQDNKLIPIGCYYLEGKPSPYYLNENIVTVYTGGTKTLQVLGGDYENVTWTSSDNGVVTVDNNGTLIAVESGKAVVTALVDGYTLKAQITVKELAPEAFPTFYIDEVNGLDTNTGRTVSSPLKSLAKATEKASINYGAGDTVSFRFIGATATYNAQAYEYLAVLSSADPEISIASMKLGALQGDTVFEDINVSTTGIVNFDGNNVGFKSTANGEFFNRFLFFKDSSKAVTEEQSIIFEQKLRLTYIVLAADYNSAMWEKAVNLVVDNPTSTDVSIYVGNDKAAYSTTYKDNVNIILKDISSLSTILVPDTSTFEKDVQIINSSSVDVSATTYTDLAKIDSSKLWILNNQTKGLKDALNVTTTTGKYAVDTDKYMVTATKQGDDTVYTAANGVLDLTAGGAGTYTYTVSKQPQSKAYYVGDGKDFANIVEAINAVKAEGELTLGDTLILNVTSNIEWGSLETPKHDFNLVITAALETAPTVTTIHKTKLGGNTTFGKIVLAIQPSYAYAELFFNDHDVIFESDSEIVAWDGIVVLGDDTTENSDDGQRLEIKSNVGDLRIRLSDRKTPRSYTGDINIVVDNIAGDTDAVMTFSLEDSNGGTTNYQNVIFDIKNAVNPIKITGNNPAFAEGKGLQIINNNDAEINCSVNNENVWIIHNKTDLNDLIITPITDQDIGKFAVNSNEQFTATLNETDESVNSTNGIFDLTALGAGVYNITKQTICEHIFNQEKATEEYLSAKATCTSKAVYFKSCVCGEASTEDTFTAGKELGHCFTNYLSDNNAECEADGTETATCDHEGCNETDTRVEEGSALGHEFLETAYVSDGNATCEEDGTKTATCEREGCGKTDTIAIVGSATGHNFASYKSNNDATCTKDGTKTAICENGCGKTDTVTVTGSKKDHSYKDATCTKPKTCTVCGATSGEKLGHDYESKVKKATTSKNGKTYDKCSRCDKVTNEKTIYKIKTIKLKATKFTFNGKKKDPAIIVKDSKGKTISSKYYTVTGTKSAKKIGTYKIKITFKTKYSGSKTLTYKIVEPTVKKSSVSKLTAAKKSLKVSIKKASSVSGYQIEYSTSKSFKKSTRKTTTKTSYTIKSLKSKKTYYVRVRSYKTVGGKKFYSAWSSKKYKKTK